MMVSGALFAAMAASLAMTVQAISNVAVSSSITAGTPTTVTYSDAGSGTYQVYLAATVPGYAEGLSCYLINSTTLPLAGINISIPASVGPSADNYYAIALEPACSSPLYSAKFNFIGGTGNISDYELHLGGAPLWFASQLPCTAYNCARQCAQANYPADLSGDGAYARMNACIKTCPGVTGEPPSPCPPLASNKTTPVPTAPSTSYCPFANASATATSNSSDPTAITPTMSVLPHVGRGNFGRNVAAGVVAGVVATATSIASEI